MLRCRQAHLIKATAIVLAIALMMPMGVTAAEEETITPRASYYLAAYTAYVCAMGGGDLEIWFEVLGTGTQEYLGVMSILLYESTDNVNWTWVKTFYHTDHEQMLLTGAWEVMDYVDYDEAIPGRYYKAYVGIWGGPDDCGDARYIWTEVERAT